MVVHYSMPWCVAATCSRLTWVVMVAVCCDGRGGMAFSMAAWRSSKEQLKAQMNTALYTGHIDIRAPAGLALFLGGQPAVGLQKM